MAEPEEQHKGGSASGADMTEQAVVDGDVPVAEVDEMIKQRGTKHHSNMEKMEQHFARIEAQHGAPTMVE
jgi:hypothetical protein